MKAKILLTALISFLLVNGKAFSNSSSLIIDVLEHPTKTYLIELDNGTTYETAVDIRIDHLRFGQNGLRIFKRSIRGSRRNPRYEDRLVYQGSIHIPNNSVVHSQLVNRNLLINSIIRKRPPHRPDRNFGMNPRAFQQLKRSVVNESFDRDRLELLSYAARNGNFNSRQVAELMSYMSFDSYKLKFAKIAYRSTVDQQNYLIVRDGLTFSSNRRKLMNFINRQPNCPPRHGRRGNNGQRRR